MSDFTFTVGNAAPDHIGQWSQGVMPGPALGTGQNPQVPDRREQPRARRSDSTLGFRGLFDGPPADMLPGESSWETTPPERAPPHRVAFSVGGSRPTARPEHPVNAAQRAAYAPRPAPALDPQLNAPPVSRRRRAPTPAPPPVQSGDYRDINAAQRRGYVSSEAGVTDIDDPVPSYHSQAPIMSGAVPADDYLSAGELEVYTVMGDDNAVVPDDSVSSYERHRVSGSSRSRRGSGSTHSTATSISLSDSSVDRIANKLAKTGLGGVASSRRTLDVVPEEAATSARNRKRHSLRHESYSPAIASTGAKIMIGAQEVYRDSRGNLVLLRHRK